MRTKIIYILALIISISCSDFLDKNDKQTISKDDLFTTLSGFKEALAGAYADFGSQSYYGASFIVNSEIRGGNLKFSDILDNGKLKYFKNAYEFNSSRVDEDIEKFDESYEAIYHTISLLNTIINEAEKTSSIAQEDKKNILAQAKTLRALCHFDLLRTFAMPYIYTQNAQHNGIYYIEKPILYDSKLTMYKVFDCYQKIIKDLKEADQNFGNPLFGSSKYFVSPKAVKALLARVSLYKQDWDQAINYATEVINSSSGLLDSASVVASWLKDEPNKENILAFQKTYNQSAALNSFMGPNTSVGSRLFVSKDLSSLYDSLDVRTQFFVKHSSGNLVSSKYSLNASAKDHFIPIIRLSEMYLIRAEASTKIAEPNEKQARSDLDVIRQRALPHLPKNNFSDKQLDSAIFAERRKEFAHEGHIFYDIARLGKNIERKDCNATQNKTLKFPNKLFMLPFPERSVEVHGYDNYK